MIRADTRPQQTFLTGLEGLASPQWQASPGVYTQYPGERMDYSIDYSAFLPEGDRIVTSVWAVDGVLVPSSWPDSAAPPLASQGVLSATATSSYVAALSGDGALSGLVEADKFELPAYLPGRGVLSPAAYAVGDAYRGAGLLGGGALSVAAAGNVVDFGLTIGQFSFTAITTTVWVGPGGVAGDVYEVVNTITTAGGRVAVRRLFFRIKHLFVQ